MYRVAAASVAAVHGLVFFMVLIGTTCALFGLLRRRPVMSSALFCLLLSLILSELLTGGCLLTTWEVQLLNRAEPGSAYEGSFLTHYFPFVPPAVFFQGGPPFVVAGAIAIPFWMFFERRVRCVAGRSDLDLPAELGS